MKKQEEYEIKLVETTEIMVWKYPHGIDRFELIYDKDKDLVIIMKNGRYVENKALGDSEARRYKEVLEMAIAYHHEKEDNLTH